MLEMVDNTLGILPTGEDNQSRIRNPSESMALLFVSSTKQIVGFLLAERISNKSNTISKTKAIVLFKRTLELGLAKLDKYLLNSVYSFWAKLHEVIHLHSLECIISLILAQWPCE